MQQPPPFPINLEVASTPYKPNSHIAIYQMFYKTTQHQQNKKTPKKLNKKRKEGISVHPME
jgi:hypothetical protein